MMLDFRVLSVAFAFAFNVAHAGDEEIQKKFRQFLESHETVLADQAIVLAQREGKTEQVRRLRFEAVKRLTSANPKGNDTDPALLDQLNKLLVEVPSVTWTATEKSVLASTKAVIVDIRPRPWIHGADGPLSPPDPLLLPEAYLRHNDTFENIMEEIESTPRLTDGPLGRRNRLTVAYPRIFKLELTRDSRAVDVLINLYRENPIQVRGESQDSKAILPVLRRIGGQKAADFLFEVYQNKDDAWIVAGEQLVLMEDPRILNQDRQSLVDQAESIAASDKERDLAHRILRKMKDPQTVEPLIRELRKILKPEHMGMYEQKKFRRLILTLGEIGDARAIDPLEEAFDVVWKADPISSTVESLREDLMIGHGLLGHISKRYRTEELSNISSVRDLRRDLNVARALARLHVNSTFKVSVRAVRNRLALLGMSPDIIDSVMAEFGKEKLPYVKEREVKEAQAAASGFKMPCIERLKFEGKK